MKLSETPALAAKKYERLDIHRERALPTDVVISREELVQLLKRVHDTSYTYKPDHKLWKEVIENIAGTQANGHPSQGQRLTRKELLKSDILVVDLIKYDERTEQAEEA
jgi:methylase of polypeptide subunit release factors